MKKLTGNQIRSMWLEFFKSKGHEIIPSASLIPHNDPTLLWINSGVAALKKYFDGSEMPKNKRITNVVLLFDIHILVIASNKKNNIVIRFFFSFLKKITKN